MQFQVSFVDHCGRVFSKSALEAKSERDAISVAKRIYKSGIGAGYLIWREDALVHSEWLDTRPPFLVMGKMARTVFAA